MNDQFDNSKDDTEMFRRIEQERLNSEAAAREVLEAQYGQVWDSAQVREQFEMVGFMAPYVVVKRKSDGARGTLSFQHHPRFYFEWWEDKGAGK